jgi:hypothetical protein
MTVAEAKVEGPLDGRIGLITGAFDLGAAGYTRAEFYVSGTATSYRRSDGGVAPADTAEYRTRIVAYRPTDPAAFSGTVALEWFNVSAGADGAPDWMMLHRQLMRSGAAWVGVSAQRASVEGGSLLGGSGGGLRDVNPQRYGSLVHPGDAFAFDIYSQVAQAVRDPATAILGGTTPARVIALGESQSAMFLVTYVNAVDRLAQVVDGFLVHGRGKSGPALDGTLRLRGTEVAAQAAPEPIHDARVPVITVQSETDLMLLGGLGARCDDSANTRLWEIAGAAHFDTYGLMVSSEDDGTMSIARMAELIAPTDKPMGMPTTEPINSGPQQHYVVEAAFAALERWVTEGVPAPHAPLLETEGELPHATFVVDEHGNARGGVRTPWVDAPTAVLSGEVADGEGFTFLFGVTRSFDAAKLAALYPGGVEDYLAKFCAAAEQARAAGFLLDADMAEITDLARASWPNR